MEVRGRKSLEHAVTRRQTVSWPLSVKSLCPRPPNQPAKGWSRKGKLEQIVAQGQVVVRRLSKKAPDGAFLHLTGYLLLRR